ncbi:MAG TPA: hypothetical protein VF268_00645 [Gammaproteobacteria bacterium]
MNLKADYVPWPHDFLRSLHGLPDLPPDHEKSLQQAIARLKLPPGLAATLARLYYPLAVYLLERLAEIPSPLVLGINGAQGTGKSTAARILKVLLERGFGRHVCAISIDDLYLTREARGELAINVHPLLATRGVPGTHNVNLGLRVLESLQKAGPHSETVIPRFDKAHDQPFPCADQEIFVGHPDFILFEGWCVGAVPEPLSALTRPVNELERREDGDGEWRRYVNKCLADYQPLFQKIDILAMLKAPSFDKVYEWRALQEKELQSQLSKTELRNSRLMSGEKLKRFLMHYERLTRWMLTEMPDRADFTFELDDKHSVEKITVKVVR